MALVEEINLLAKRTEGTVAGEIIIDVPCAGLTGTVQKVQSDSRF